MKRILKIGLILAIPLLMLLPVHARAQMSLNNLQNAVAGGTATVANITATRGNTISFGLNSSLSNSSITMPTNPDPGVAIFSNGTFTWNTGGSSPVTPGSYIAAFDGENETQAEHLVVLITINSSTGDTCTYFTYSDWSVCQSNNTQTRTVTSSSPTGCVGGTPILSQSCTYAPPTSTCTSFTYSDWSACQSNNTQTRTVTSSSPTGCVGGNPILSQSCTYAPPSPSPPNAQLLPLNIPNSLNLSPGIVYTYICRLVGDTITLLKVDILGRTNETYLSWTWRFPDGTIYSGTADAAAGGGLYFRSRNSPSYPNYPHDYIPSGDHILTINPIANSSVLLTVGYY